MQISITITGVKQVEEKLKRLGVNLYDFSGAMRDVGKTLSSYYSNEAFASQGGVFGQNWPRLSMKYSVWKAKHFPGRPPLILTGAMQRGFRFDSNSNSVSIGNDVDYYKYHQSAASRSMLPRRQMAGINDPVRQKIAEIIQRDVKQKIDRA